MTGSGPRSRAAVLWGAEQSLLALQAMRARSRLSCFSLSPAGTLAALDCGGWHPPHSLTAPVSSPKLPTGMGTLLSCQGTVLPASPPNKPCCCQAAGAKTNKNSSVTQVLCRKGGGLSGRKSGKCPGPWVRAREKEPVVTIPTSPSPADGSVNGTQPAAAGHRQRAKGRAKSQGIKAAQLSPRQTAVC